MTKLYNIRHFPIYVCFGVHVSSREASQQFYKCIVLVTLTEPLHSTISPEISNSKFSTATPFNNSTSDSPGASNIGTVVGVGFVVVVVVGGGGCYICNVSIITII